MATSDPIEVLLAHNSWANLEILKACRGLTREQFHQDFEMGLGSLHATMTHVLGAVRGWGDLLASREQRERLEAGGNRTVEELIALNVEVSTAFETALRASPLDGEASGERGGRKYTFTRGAVLAHVMTHGVHHRAQCVNMLRQLGIEPLPPSAVLEWMMSVDGQG